VDKAESLTVGVSVETYLMALGGLTSCRPTINIKVRHGNFIYVVCIVLIFKMYILENNLIMKLIQNNNTKSKSGGLVLITSRTT
jgi:hypothetical protein